MKSSNEGFNNSHYLSIEKNEKEKLEMKGSRQQTDRETDRHGSRQTEKQTDRPMGK